MKQPAWVIEAIAAGEKYHIRKKSPLIHNVINVSAFLMLGISWVVLIWVRKLVSPIFYIPFATLGIAFIFQCLNFFVSHEASHGAFITCKNEQQRSYWNHLFGIVACIPIGINYVKYFEVGHMIHHRNISRSEDPNNCNPKNGTALYRNLAKVLLIPGYIQWMGIKTGKGIDFDCPEGEINGIYWRGIFLTGGFWAMVAALCYFTGFLAFPFFIAQFYSFQVVGAVRLLISPLQHGTPVIHEENLYFRSLTVFFPLDFLMLPFNFKYHVEHHFCGSIPWYDLPKYHRELLKIFPSVLQSYFFIREPLKQILGHRQALPLELRHLLNA